MFSSANAAERSFVGPADPEFARLLAEEQAIEDQTALANDPNRRVHASSDQMEVVRYNRTSKWYLEPTNRDLPRQKVTIDEAVRYAAGFCDTVNLNLSGGTTFDRKYRAATSG